MAAPTARPVYGMTCAQCGDLLIAPDSSEWMSERNVRHLWSCRNCDCRFETSASVPANAESKICD
jgi:Zn-finger protein